MVNAFEDSITFPNDAAFARPEAGSIDGTYGLTKREYFAATAMAGLLARGEAIDSQKEYAELAVSCADALIEALNK